MTWTEQFNVSSLALLAQQTAEKNLMLAKGIHLLITIVETVKEILIPNNNLHSLLLLPFPCKAISFSTVLGPGMHPFFSQVIYF